MKYLLIGIDGCQAETIHRYPMPFTQGLLAQGVSLKLHEDLLSRGWVEICTGQHAIDNDGYYERARLDGTPASTTKYNLLEQISQDPDIPTLWGKLNSLGMRVGVMNVPTTNPAPVVDGFFVSGGGGGSQLRDEICPSQCYPADVKQALDDLEYIVDERIPSLLFEKKLYDEAAFFSRLKLMTDRRVDAFIKLGEQYQIDFGFIVFRSVVVVENICIGEYKKFLSGQGDFNPRLIEAMQDFYAHFDGALRRLIESIGADRVGLVSDHGTVVAHTRVNLNAILRNLGVQYRPAGKNGLMALAQRYKHLVPYAFRQKLKGNQAVAREYAAISNFDRKRSEAFCPGRGSSFLGIYVNDSVRFGGPVDSAGVTAVAQRIASRLNAERDFLQLGLKAVMTQRPAQSKYAKYLPDIVVQAPDGVTCNIQQAEFAAPGVDFTQPMFLNNVVGDFATGTKGPEPLACFVNHTVLNPDSLLRQDLAEVFRIVLAEFGQVSRINPKRV